MDRHIDECLNETAIHSQSFLPDPHPIASSPPHERSPFEISCPYPSCGEKMEAKFFVDHALSHHSTSPQNFACPICYLLTGVIYAPKNDTHLLNHLTEHHGDLIGKGRNNGTNAFLLELDYGNSGVEEVLQRDLDQDCLICMEGLKSGERVERLDCFCVFHKDCIEHWFQHKGARKCPLHKREN